MANECLLTKLKGIVENNDLPVLGAYAIGVVPKIDGAAASDFEITLGMKSGASLKISAPDGKIYASADDWSNDANGVTELTISSESKVWLKNGEYRASVTSKYDIVKMRVTSQFDIESIASLVGLNQLYLDYPRNTILADDLVGKDFLRFQVAHYEKEPLDISNIKASRVIVTNSTNISGNIEQIAAHKFCIELWGGYTGMAGSAGGTVEGFVETTLAKIVSGEFSPGANPTSLVVMAGTFHGVPNTVSLTISYNKNANSATVSVTGGNVVGTFDGTSWTYL